MAQLMKSLSMTYFNFLLISDFGIGVSGISTKLLKILEKNEKTNKIFNI